MIKDEQLRFFRKICHGQNVMHCITLQLIVFTSFLKHEHLFGSSLTQFLQNVSIEHKAK